MKQTATLLADARRNGGAVSLADLTEPATFEEAYAVQDEIIRLLDHPIAGFKVGSTSKEAQKILGTKEPGSCPVPAPYLHQSPANIDIYPEHYPAIEGEFAFRLGRDLPARSEPYSRGDVIAAIDAVAGAIEVVGTRIDGGVLGKGRYLVTADCGANIELVIGNWTTDWKALDLKAHRVAITVNGEARSEGVGARALDDPMNVMIWLANHQSSRGRGLKKGQCVSTGTCTGIDRVNSGDRAVADFGSLGTVEIDFT